MEYYFDQLDPIKFQRLINTILIARFGEDARLTPLRGKDGGRDGETAPGNPYFEFQVSETVTTPRGFIQPPRKGRHLFQVKHHRTSEKSSSEARQAVIADFRRELESNVLNRMASEQVNYFFLITNVPGSRDAIAKIDKVRHDFLAGARDFHADVWWKETVTANLDLMPWVWNSFPEMFAGNMVPLLAQVVNQESGGLPRAIRIAINQQYDRDKIVKFRQIELERILAKLFVDLDIDIRDLPRHTQQKLVYAEYWRRERYSKKHLDRLDSDIEFQALEFGRHSYLVSALSILLNDDKDAAINKLILEGGPGQGKSTITQMVVQIYRQQLLGRDDMDPEKRWIPPQKVRLPFRIELRRLAEWLSSNPNNSVEEYLTTMIKQDSGGSVITVNDIHSIVEQSPVLLIFDGLDEIGSDKLRDDVLRAIIECIKRFENLLTDLRVIVTTRPPALAGRGEVLIDFERLLLAPMEKHRIEEYLTRWLSVQVPEKEEKIRIRESFERRQAESHVEALAKNPMQLSVLLQFIRLKGEAFPDRRAELYRDYFQIVIDRDVEKTPELRENRDVIQALHEFIGYKIHALTEVNQADRTLERKRLLEMVKEWLILIGHEPEMAQRFFKLGEERFGLIVASKGEGEETRYGYAVQPIQEYFAAAFINNQILPDKPHAVFEAMIHRPYWKEVALFLAGLRKPNEKADLIACAKSIDRDRGLGWFLDGRAIILELLQEGVFSDPRYVFSLALEFIFDLLDANRLSVQREPSKFLGTLDNILSHPTQEQHEDYILRLLRDYNSCEDPYIMMRLYRVASRVLNANDFWGAAMSYEGKHSRLKAVIRLGWPYRWEIAIDEALLQDISFWDDVPDHIWVQTLWRESFRRGVVLDLNVPTRFHQLLVEQFASNPISDVIFQHSRGPFIETYSKLAIWKMVRLQQMLQVIGVSQRLAENVYDTIRKFVLVSQDDSDTDYSGLDEPFQSMLKNIIQLSHDILKAFCNHDETEKSRTSTVYINRMREYLQHPGLESWVAYQCTISFIQGVVFDEFEHASLRRLQAISYSSDIISLVEDIRPFHVGSTLGDFEEDKDQSWAVDYLMGKYTYPRFLQPYSPENFPKSVRLKARTKPTPLVEILTNSILREQALPFEWMKRMVLSTEVIRPLVEENRNYLPNLLDLLGKHQFVHTGGAKLRVQDTQRLLKIARNTDNPKTLSTIAIVLSTASYVRIAKPALILKLLRSDFGIYLAPNLFRTYNPLNEEYGMVSSTKEVGLIEEVSRGVLSKPNEFPFETVCQAADFLAEHSPIELPPLLCEEEQLGIRIRQPV